MKKIILSLAAIAALSTASIAAERNYDLRDSDTYSGRYATQTQPAPLSVNAFPVRSDDAALTAFERMTRTAIENDNGGR
jgi:hypothetical protein